MSFLSLGMLLFGLTAAVPVLLHLHHRRKRVVTDFSTNRFFTEAIQRAQRRLQLRRLLLLLLRVAACLLLAAALARPMVDWGGIGIGHAGRRDLVVLLDDSLSMQAGGDEGETGAVSAYDRARSLAVQALSALAPGDRAAVVTLSGRPVAGGGDAAPGLTADVRRLADATAALPPAEAAGDAAAALARAGRLLRHSDERARLVLAATDLQRGDWRHSAWPPPPRPTAGLLAVTGPPPGRNVVLAGLRFPHGEPVVRQPALLVARVINYAPASVEADVVLTVDGAGAEQRRVTLPGGGETELDFPLVFEKEGEHRLAVTAAYADALPADNTRYRTVRVGPPPAVLFVDGPAAQPGAASAVFYLERAVRALGGGDPVLPVALVSGAALGDARLDEYRVIVLNANARPPDSAVDRLRRFVTAGGGLLLVCGEGADTEWFNRTLGPGGNGAPGGPAPSGLGRVVSRTAPRTPTRIGEIDMRHPVFERLGGVREGALAGVVIHKIYAAAPAPGARVIAATDTWQPLLLDRTYGEGRVLQITTSPVPDWSNLAQRKVFLPLVSHVLRYLAEDPGPPPAGETGRALEAPLEGWEPGRKAAVLLPDGSRAAAAVRLRGGHPVMHLAAPHVSQAGFYRVLTLEADDAEKARGPALAVNTPPAESVPGRLDPAEAERRAGAWGLRVRGAGGADTDDTLTADLLERSRVRRGVWAPLLWVVLAAVIVEPLIANRIVRSEP
ncbi:MAG: BatA and WFA domain-containing protein [Lentisphaerae bacterium]|nr:BatA and WFA domain-containing protein [Lentisphaerota bacterium]